MKTLPRAAALVLSLAATTAIQAADAVRVVPSGAIAHPRQPQAAVDKKGVIYVAFGAKNAIYCSVSRDGGPRFGSPVKVGETKHLALGARRGPRIVVARGTITIVTCDHSTGLLSAWRSSDGGKNWSTPVTVNDNTPSTAQEGLHALAIAPEGTLYCVWLDHRLEKKNQIFGAASHDGGKTWSKNRLVYRSPSGVCPCCHPSATFDGKGNLYVMWRNSLDGNRDMYVTVSRDGGKTFGTATKLGAGSWKLDRCPMDGGAIAVASPERVTTVWRRRKQVYRTDSGGKREQLLGAGEQPWAAASSQGAWLVWLSRRRGELWLQSPASSRPTKIASHATDPVVATPIGGKGPVVAVWETGSGREQTILARVVNE